MAVTLTTSYQLIASQGTRYGTFKLYAKYSAQSIVNNDTSFQLKTTYSTGLNTVSFSSGDAWVDGTERVYGSTTMYKGETTISEVSRRLVHNTDGTSPDREVAASWENTIETYTYISGYIKAPRINRYATITGAQDFNDEGNPTINYSNPGGNSVNTLQATIANADGTSLYLDYRDISKTGTSYTFNLTNAERNILRNATPNSNTLSITFKVKTITGSYTHFEQIKKTMTIVNGNPTFTHAEEETNTTVKNLIGDSASTIVQNLSNIKFTITPSAKKGSTIKKVELTHSGSTTSDTASPYEFTIKPTANSFSIKVTDSRGNVGTGTITKTMLNYAPVKINSFSFKRSNPTSSDIKINLDATYWNTNIGSTTNAPVVKWKMGSSGALNTIPSGSVTVDNTNHKITVTNYTLSNQLVYTSGETFYIYVNDAYTNTSNNYYVSKGIPVLDLGDDEVEVNGTFKATSTITSDSNIISKSVNVLEKIQSKPRASLTNANITHEYENNCAHLQFLVATGSMTSNKPAGDGYILHASWDNSGQYIGQFFLPNTNANRPVQFRGCNAGTWGSWENLYRAKELYNNTSGTTGTVTLSETIANFEYIEIFYGKGRPESSTRYIRGGSEYATLFSYTALSNGPQLLVKKVKISGTSITHANGYYLNFTSSGVSTGSANEIYIYRVIGWR